MGRGKLVYVVASLCEFCRNSYSVESNEYFRYVVGVGVGGLH